jgi:hypothetical protein
MNKNRMHLRVGWLCVLIGLICRTGLAAASDDSWAGASFPPSLASYHDSQFTSLVAVLRHRVEQEPLNLWATALFVCALIHTFLTNKFLHWSHVVEARAKAREQNASAPGGKVFAEPMLARVLHFLGEVEAVFGIWCAPLFFLLVFKAGWKTTMNYFDNGVGYQEPLFVVVIMAIASTRPILQLAERCLKWVAGLGGGGPAAWWLSILTIGPVLGSFITEPAAMTISALLLAKQFYERKPPARFAYATLGLLFVNISVGGVFTHFAAPPVLMVAGPWKWDTRFMIEHFGWIAFVGILIANAGYFLVFRKQFSQLNRAAVAAGADERPVPFWTTLIHLAFMGWSVLNAHHPSLLLGGFLFFLAFYEVTKDWQSDLQLRSPILVGFFLAGLVIHGGLQQWWIAPVLDRLNETPLMLGAIGLTAFNDNAAVTYLSTLVPDLTEGMKYAVVAGAVTGGGLTVIANAPNPAGYSILGRFFPEGVSALGLLLGALPATAILAACFLLLH